MCRGQVRWLAVADGGRQGKGKEAEQHILMLQYNFTETAHPMQQNRRTTASLRLSDPRGVADA